MSELEKLHDIATSYEYKQLEAFMTYIQSQGLVLCRWSNETMSYELVSTDKYKFIIDYFGIDRAKLEVERKAALTELSQLAQDMGEYES